MATISYDATYKRWRRYIARTKGIDESAVLSTDDMKAKHKFTAAGLRMTARESNTIFEDVDLAPLPKDMDVVTTVGSGARVIWNHIPEANRV